MNLVSLQLAAAVDRLHGLLTTIFPHEGVVALGGSRIFLRQPMMGVITDSVNQLNEFAELESDDSEKELKRVVAELNEWATILLALNRDSDSAKCDLIVRTLYLINGLLWDIAVTRKNGTALKPMNTITPLSGVFAAAGQQHLYGLPLERLLVDLREHRLRIK